MTARRSSSLTATLLLIVAALMTGASPANAASKGGAPSASFVRPDLSSGTHAGTAYGTGGLTLSGALTPGVYNDPFGYGAVSYESGSWTSASITTPFAFDELVASWNAATPEGTWIKIEMQATGAGRTTKWYVLQVWASGDGTIHRTSVPAQGDADGFVAIDTFIRSKKAAELRSYALRVTLYRVAASSLAPTVSFVGAMTSAASNFSIPSAFSGVVADLPVPTLSQETHAGHHPEFDGGGEAWCSPTSTAMVLDYWRSRGYASSGPTSAQLAAFPGAEHVDGQVDYAARYVYDWNYRGAGNWPNNTAYAATFDGMNGFVTRLRSLAEAERFIAAGIPLVASINGNLPGFLFKKTNGHLLVIRGFTSTGDVISNDPAVFANADARKVYARDDFEDVWLGGSAGIVYVIYPTGVSLPSNVEGVDRNW
ncbi:MAG TPA: C39 family peptidase [Candidatus Limnocylindria bacterium]|nr:C39 family peptidase [Candidatus Limnocylindria bacterium]